MTIDVHVYRVHYRVSVSVPLSKGRRQAGPRQLTVLTGLRHARISALCELGMYHYM